MITARISLLIRMVEEKPSNFHIVYHINKFENREDGRFAFEMGYQKTGAAIAQAKVEMFLLLKIVTETEPFCMVQYTHVFIY